MHTQGTAEDMVNCGTWFVGTPDQVVDQIVHQHCETGGFGTLLQLGYDYADEPAREGWMRSMELLSQEVIPAVNRKLYGSASAATVHEPTVTSAPTMTGNS